MTDDKVHTSALCWIPPEGEIFDAIQTIRRAHDRQIDRWPPHINILYPFVPSEEFESAAQKLAAALRGIEPFDVTLRDVRHFAHGGRSRTAWLHPKETADFAALQTACRALFPHCDDLTASGEFVPHLTVGQCQGESALDALKAAAGWRESRTRCGDLCLIRREGRAPFEVRWRIHLGPAAAAPEAVLPSTGDSVAPSTPATPPAPRRPPPGLGAAAVGASGKKRGGPTLEQIHATISAHVCSSLPQNRDGDAGTEEDREDERREFDDALFRLVNSTPRPTSSDGPSDLCRVLGDVVSVCDSSAAAPDVREARWKALTLALIHRRYHLRSPEAQRQKEAAAAAGPSKGGGNDAPTAGDGERVLFYAAASFLLRRAAMIAAAEGTDGSPVGSSLAGQSARCLFRVAPHAGGSRDVSALIEHGVHMIVSDVIAREPGTASDDAATSSSARLVGMAVVEATRLAEAGGSAPFAPLFELIEFAGRTLDSDMGLVRRAESGEAQGERSTAAHEREDLMSTLHVFLPHHDRGRKKGKRKRNTESGDGDGDQRTNVRNIVQCVSELLIWSRTDCAMSNGTFASAFEEFTRSPRTGEAASDPNDSRALMHRMQTVVRNQRKFLNSFARSRGYMLSEQFVIDGRAITFPQVRHGKAGDVGRLKSLAGKRGDRRVLELIAKRGVTDPSKAVPAESVRDLGSSWVPLEDAGNGDDTGGTDKELVALMKKIQEATVRATVQKLRSSREAGRAGLRPHAIASVDDSDLNHASAVLVGAALSGWAETDGKDDGDCPPRGGGDGEAQLDESERPKIRVFVADRCCDVSSLDSTMKELDAIFGSAKNRDSSGDLTSEATTTRNALNFIERHVLPGDMIILFTDNDLKLADHSMKELREKGSSIHCHNADDMKLRLRREGAKTGDVTISLMWDTGDDLDLHVVMPSKEEIYYGNKTSKCGLGSLDVDMNAGGPSSKEPVENVHLGDPEKCIQAPEGNYRVFVQNYAYHTKGAKKDTAIPWTVSVRMNESIVQYKGTCVGSGSKSNVDACIFAYEGRTVPFRKQLEEKSAFGSADIICLTASVGQTLDSLRQLVRTSEEHMELERVKQLVDDDEQQEEEEKEAADEEEGGGEAEDEATAEPMDQEQDDEPPDDAAGSEDKTNEPLVAAHGSLDVTSRDRMQILLCRLPKRFHEEVAGVFGGSSLVELCASQVARQMLRDNVPLSELKRAGYPAVVATRVRELVKKGSVAP